MDEETCEPICRGLCRYSGHHKDCFSLFIFYSFRFFPSVLNLFLYYLHNFTVFVAFFFVFVNSVSARKYCPEWFGSWMLWNVHFLIQKWFYIMSKEYVPFHPSENPSQQIFGQSLSARLHQKCTVWRLGNRCKCLFFLSVCPDVNRGHSHKYTYHISFAFTL